MEFVPSIALKGIDSLIESYGAKPTQLMAEVGFDPALLQRPDNPISGQAFNNLIEHCARSLEQRFFGLELAAIQGASILGPLWFLIRSSSTVADAVQCVVDNFPSHTLITYWGLTKTASGELINYDVDPAITGEHTQIIELGLGIVCLNLRRYLGHHWKPQAAYFKGSEPYAKKAMMEVFGENIHFNQETNSILLTHHELKQPFHDSKQLQQLHYQRIVKNRNDFQARSIVTQAENIINTSLTMQACTLDFVARCLNLNPRTLRHQLQKQGTSFQELLKQAKLNLALRYLNESNLSITNIAERLHFSDTAVFSRFIKKHTGRSPTGIRAEKH